jgi:hypothetical protein
VPMNATGTPGPIKRSSKTPAREIRRTCPRCGHVGWELNGAYFGYLRRLARVPLKEMSQACDGVSVQLLSQMERGRQRFLPKYAAVYDRLLERVRRAGEPS